MKKPKRNRPPKTATERKQSQRERDRAFLRSAGWDGTPDAFLAAWRKGAIRVTFERVKGNDDARNT